MIIELGHFALVLALIISLMQAVLPLWGAARGKQAWMMIGRQCVQSVFWLTTIALTALLHAYTLSDFSVLNVASNSNTMKPMLYKVAALWGNHEGSMLLWIWILTLWNYLVYRAGRNLPPLFLARVIGVQGMVVLGFALFILLTSNPFLRLDPPAPEGLDLNPVLQDPLLVIHPPFLYLGYIGFSVAFCFAVAALIERRIDAAFARFLRPWVLWAWIFLTVGIALGSFWAYYELGWGGFWFWDPVENASLLPWLAGTALLHSLVVLDRRGGLPGWTVFLALLTFCLSLLGTFLVRSGVLTSVHAFAADPARGVFLLALLALAAGGALALYALRAPDLKAGSPFGLLSRDAALLMNNVFLCVFLTTVFMGTLYPVFLSALDLTGVSVGTPYYVAVLTPLLLPFAFLMGAAPALHWRQTAQKQLKKLAAPAALTALVLAILWMLPMPKNLLVFAGMAAGVWIVSATLHDLWRRTGALRSWRGLPRSYHGMFLAHAGLGLLIIGATAATQWSQERIVWMKGGDRLRIAHYNVLLLGVETGLGRNYNADRAMFSVQSQSRPADFAFMTPERRWYPVQEKLTSETALHFRKFDVVYLVLGDQDREDRSRWVVRAYYHPLLMLVFLGAGLMAAGGAVSALSRRRKEETP